MSKEYVKILEDSLVKKDKLLEEILRLSEEQKEIIKEKEIEWEKFNDNVEAKGKLVDEINEMDEGFEKVYERVKEEFNTNKEEYSDSIKRMKELIKSITEKSADIESLERRNKAQIEASFARTKQTIRQSKVGGKAAMEYYQKMNKINTVNPQMMDKKS